MNTVAGSALGTVKFFNTKKNFGFVATDNGDIYIRQQAAGKRANMLVPGMTVNVTYYTEDKDKGPTASSIDFPRYRGKVKWFNEKKGFGFIACDKFDGQDVFLHATRLKSEVSAIESGAEVDFFLIADESGRLSAYDVLTWALTTEAA